jgi:hypothetical protein
LCPIKALIFRPRASLSESPYPNYLSVAQNMIDHFRLQNNNNVPLTASEYDLKLNQNRTGLVLNGTLANFGLDCNTI